ncbi:MAG: tetratricopeptide repeat protein [Dehalococcoidia bacterium]|nr:tetratricopeptide repeat protein [Dehalococcoidia bacterium]
MTGSRLTIAALLTLAGFLLLPVPGILAQEPSSTDLMAAANGRYERGEFAEAAQQYENLIAMGYENTALYYNIGNAYLESGDPGRAILNYLRAEELSPRNPNVRANLDLARSMTLDRIETERDSLVESVSYLGRRWVTPGELGTVALLFWVIGALVISTLLLWRTAPLRAALRIVGGVSTVTALLAFALLLNMLYANPYDSAGVVTAESVEALSGPGFQYTEEFTLHSGAQVRLLDARQGWMQVALPGGEISGWMPAHAAELVRRGGNE